MGEYLFETVKDKEVPLAEQVAEQIRQLIIDRQLTHGEKLPNEFELAQQLNVGRGTVREAAKLLVARNVLEIRRGRGTFVARHTGVVNDPLGFAYMPDQLRLAHELLDIRLIILTLRIIFSKDSTEGIDVAMENQRRADELWRELDEENEEKEKGGAE